MVIYDLRFTKYEVGFFMYESQERYKKDWASCGDDAVTPAGFISARNLAGIIGCSDATVRVQLQRAGLMGKMMKRMTADEKKLIGQMLVYPKDEALDFMYAWEERREAMYEKKVARIERAEERRAARREKEAEERRRIAEERAKVRAERKRMFQERKAELAREKERRKLEREREKARRQREKVRERRRVARERVRAGDARAK